MLKLGRMGRRQLKLAGCQFFGRLPLLDMLSNLKPLIWTKTLLSILVQCQCIILNSLPVILDTIPFKISLHQPNTSTNICKWGYIRPPKNYKSQKANKKGKFWGDDLEKPIHPHPPNCQVQYFNANFFDDWERILPRGHENLDASSY